MSFKTDLAPLRDRLVALRRQTLVTLAEQPQDGSLDAGLLALVANVQAVLVAVDKMIDEAGRPHRGPDDATGEAGHSGLGRDAAGA